MPGKSTSSSSKPPSQRMLRVGESIRHRMAELLARGEIHDEVISSHLITIPEVRISPDLRLATIYVMPLAGKDVKPVIEALNRNKRFIRAEIVRSVNLKYAPDIQFRADLSFEESARIEALLRSPKVAKDLEKE